MTLCDAGPLVALVDKSDVHHGRCVAALRAFPDRRLLTTWVCLAEAMHLLKRAFGWRAQDTLWDLVAKEVVRLHAPADGEWQRMRTLMRDYADTPMDLADASVVAAAETLRQRTVFTIDHHFYIYRQTQGHAFERLCRELRRRTRLSLQQEKLHTKNGLRATESLTLAGRGIITGSIPDGSLTVGGSGARAAPLLRISRWLVPRFAEDRLCSRSTALVSLRTTPRPSVPRALSARVDARVCGRSLAR
jgi:predicted nucleic acid-binding protein